MPPIRRIAPFVQRAHPGGAVLIGSRPRSTNAGSTRASFRLYRANRPILIAPSSAESRVESEAPRSTQASLWTGAACRRPGRRLP